MDTSPRSSAEGWAFEGEVFGILNLRWNANHRYFSERQLLDHLNNLRYERRAAMIEFEQKGSHWKNVSRTLLDLAYEVINLGEAKWSDLPSKSGK
jgi:hypothetical protein